MGWTYPRVTIYTFSSVCYPHRTDLCLLGSLYCRPHPAFISLSQPKLQCVNLISSLCLLFFQSQMLFFSFMFPSATQTEATCSSTDLILPEENVSPWINVADNTFNISLQQSRALVAWEKNAFIFYQFVNPSVFSCSPHLPLSHVPQGKSGVPCNRTFSNCAALIRG